MLRAEVERQRRDTDRDRARFVGAAAVVVPDVPSVVGAEVGDGDLQLAGSA